MVPLGIRYHVVLIPLDTTAPRVRACVRVRVRACVCARVCARACARARARVRACVRVPTPARAVGISVPKHLKST